VAKHHPFAEIIEAIRLTNNSLSALQALPLISA
jgi:hypothetical protein